MRKINRNKIFLKQAVALITVAVFIVGVFNPAVGSHAESTVTCHSSEKSEKIIVGDEVSVDQTYEITYSKYSENDVSEDSKFSGIDSNSIMDTFVRDVLFLVNFGVNKPIVNGIRELFTGRKSNNDLNSIHYDSNEMVDDQLDSEKLANPLNQPLAKPMDSGSPSPLGRGNLWWNHNWLHRKQITINHSFISDDLANFPVLILIENDSDLADDTKCQNDGDDIVFVDNLGIQLHHEIEFFNGTDLVCWVNVSRLNSTEDTILYMYYGNSTVENCQDVEHVWDKNYVLVQHLNETSGTHYDSSGYNNDGTPMNGINQNAIGMIDGTDNLDGSNDYIDCGTNGSLDITNSITVSAWARIDIDEHGRLVSKHSGPQGNYGWALIRHDGYLEWALSTDGSDWNQGHTSSGSFPVGSWVYVTTTFDGEYMQAYMDGVEDTGGNLPLDVNGTINVAPASTQIGRDGYSGDSNCFDGLLDEIRISKTIRNASWIETEYHNRINISEFLIVGNEEIIFKPYLSNENPSDGAIGIPLQPTLSIMINDTKGDNVEWCITSNASGSWQELECGTLIGGNGTVSTSNTSDIDQYETMYWWSVNSTDPDGSGNWTNETYCFYTRPENYLPVLTNPQPENGTTNIIPGEIDLSITVSDLDNDLMNLIFMTNASGGWSVIGTNTSQPNGTYMQMYNFEKYNATYWWSVHCSDGSGNWSNITNRFSTRDPPSVHLFTLDSLSHDNYGLSYPITFIFDIPSNATNCKVFKYKEGSWIQLTEKTENDTYSGIETVRFNYTEDKAYVSVSFTNNSDNLYVKITDSSENLIYTIYDNIATYYDDNQVAFVLAGDDWNDPHNSDFVEACDACQARNIWLTAGIIPYGMAKYSWGPPNWTMIQQQVSEGFVEPASHGKYHLQTPYDQEQWGVQSSYDEEIGGCKQYILENVTMPALNCRGSEEFLYAWIEPFGNYDSTVHQKLAEYDYLCDRSTGSSTGFASWDDSVGVYNRIGVSIDGDGKSTSQLNSQFDSVYSSGGIHHIYCHPRNHDWQTGSIVGHLDYVANRSDVWYVGFGHLYAYHYMADQDVISHSTFTGDLPPVVSLESPVNGSTGVVPDSIQLGVNIQDVGDLMNLTFMTNASGSWQVIGSNLSVGNGRYTQIYAFADYDRMYYWRVHCGDGMGWTNGTYVFSTRPENYLPVLTNPLPINGKTGVSIGEIDLSITVSDRDNDSMNITFLTNASGSWSVIGTNNSQKNGTYTQSYSFDQYETCYWWRVNCFDGKGWTNETFVFTTREAPITDPFNQGWQYRREIIIDHDLVAGNLTGFPVLISISGDADLSSHTQPDGDDLLFMDDVGDAYQLPHEIEFFNGTDLICWVNVSSLSSTQDTIFYMYSGNPAVENCQDVEHVWDENYVLVQHLNETSGTHYDSSGYNNDGTPTGGINQNAIGVIDGTDDFDGSNDYIDCGTDSSLDVGSQITVSIWTKIDIDEHRRLISRHGGGSYGWSLLRHDGYLDWALSTDGSDWNEGFTSLASFPVGSWVYVTATFDGEYMRAYINGMEDTGQNLPLYVYGSINNAPVSTQIGRDGYSGDTNVFDGILDEARISKTVRNASWILTEYNNQNETEMFVEVGEEEESSRFAIGNPFPPDEATDQIINPGLSIQVNDTLGGTMDITFLTNASTGIWHMIGVNSSQPNGTYSCSNTSEMSNYNAWYWWAVNVTGSGNWTNKSFRFRTRPQNYEPVLSNPYPSVGSFAIIPGNVNLIITVNDTDGNMMDITFRTNATGVWNDIGSNSSKPNGTYTQLYNFDKQLWTYWWSVNCSDGTSWTNETYNFTTGELKVPNPFTQGWQYRREIIINHSLVAGNLSGFPVMIRIQGDNNLSNHAQSDGDDILFMDDVGDAYQLPHEIEFFNGTDLFCWVNISSLSSTQDTVLYMYYGNPSSENCENVADVWDSGFVGVWHMNETSGSTVYDSSRYSNDGTPNGVNLDNLGIADGGDDFTRVSNTVGDFVDCGTGSSLNPTDALTIEAWVNFDDVSSAAGRQTIMGKYYENYEMSLLFDKSPVQYSFYKYGDNTGHGYDEIRSTLDSSVINAGDWHLMAAGMSGTSMVLYFDGDVNATDTGTYSGTVGNSDHLNIGRRVRLNHQYVGGVMDEVRLSSVLRNESWIKTEYNNLKNIIQFYNISEETVSDKPIISNEQPNNGAFDIGLNPTLSANLTDSQDDSIDWLICSNASGSWQVFEGGILVGGNGTISTSNTSVIDEYETMYWWSVNATDPLGSGIWNNMTFCFTTVEEIINHPFNQGWQYRREIVINHSLVAGNLSGFPVMIRIQGDSNLSSHTQPDGDDILFMNGPDVADQLPHEIEFFNGTDLVCWVNLSSLSSTEDTVLYMYYGNSSVESMENVNMVWDDGYLGVWHMNETSGSVVYDSTSYGNDGTPSGVNLDAVGIADGGDDFDGNNDYVDCGTDSSLNPTDALTLEAWVNFDDVSSDAGRQTLMGKYYQNYEMSLLFDKDPKQFSFYKYGTGTGNYEAVDGYFGTGEISSGNWHYFASGMSGTSMILYFDGDVMATDTGTYSGTVGNSDHLNIGRRVRLNTQNVGGVMDEVRLSSVLRNESWIKTEYTNLKDPDLFYSIDNEEPNISTDTVPPEIIDNTLVNAYTGDSFTFNASVTDNLDYPSVYVEYWYGTGSHTNVSMTATGFDYYFEKTITVDDNTDILYYIISANDTVPNWNNTGQLDVGNVIDNDVPKITNVVAFPSTQKTGEYINISCNIDDNINVDEVWVNVTYPDDSYYNNSMLGGSYYWNVSYTDLGSYDYLIWANDTSGNANTSSTFSFYIYNSSVVYVDDDYTVSTPGWQVDHFDNIQDGIDNVTETGSVFVYNGTYNENVIVDKTINLTGENRNETIIDGGGTDEVVIVTADWTNISGFIIKNSGSSIYDAGIDVAASSVKIEDCNVSGNNIGIYSAEWSTLWENISSMQDAYGTDTHNNETIIVSHGDRNITKRNASTGELIWSTTFGEDNCLGVAFDSNHNFAVVGFDKYSTYGYQWYLEYYNGTTNSLIWSGLLEFSGTTAAPAECAFDSDDHLIIAGKGGTSYPTVAKYYPNNGTKIWSVNDNSGYDWGIQYSDVAIDSNDNIIVCGSLQGSYYTARIRKLDTDGNVLWSKTPGSSSSNGRAVDVDSEENILFCYNDPSGSTTRLIKYDPDGNVIWEDNTFGSEVSFIGFTKSLACFGGNNWVVGGYTGDASRDLIYYFLDSDGDKMTNYTRIHLGTNDLFNQIQYDKVGKRITMLGRSGTIAWCSILIPNKNINIKDNIISENENGLFLISSSNNTISGNNISTNNNHGIYLHSSDNNILTNITVVNNQGYGCKMYNSDHNQFICWAVTSNLMGGFAVKCDDNLIKNTNIDCNGLSDIGINASGATNITVDNTNITNCTYGILLQENVSDSILNNNRIYDNNIGIYLDQFTNKNIIYNNYFNNTENAYDYGTNIYNITKTLDTNIISGSYLGGNYWSNYTGFDINGDGLGDTDLPYNNSGKIQNGGDWLPLTDVGWDTAPPEITNVHDTPDPQEVNGYVNITCDVIDDVAVDEVWVNITGPAGFTPVNTTMNEGSYYHNESYSIPGVYSYFIWANDTSNNNNMSSINQFTINPNQPPTHDNPLLESEFGTNTTNEYLICSNQSTSDLNDDDVFNTYHWFKDGTSLTHLLLPFNTENSTKVKDYSGYNHDGTVNGGPTWTSNGKVGGAYLFNGDGNISITETPDLNFSEKDLTIEMWMNISSWGDTGNYYSGYAFSKDLVRICPCNMGIMGIPGYPQRETMLATVDGWSQGIILPDYSISLNTWYHVVLTYNGTHQKLYIDGNLEGTSTSYSGNITRQDGDIIIGDNDDGDRYFNGIIDEVAVYYRELSAEQIAQNYQQSKNGFSKNATVVSEETRAGDIWKCEVTPSDLQLDGIAKESNTLIIVDITPPEITSADAQPDPQFVGGFVNITCDVTDNVEVNMVKVNITYPNSSSENLTMDGGSYYKNQTYAQIGVYSYFIWANDTSGYANTSDVYDFYIYDPSIVYVDDDYDSNTPGWQVDHFDNIQDGIDNVTETGTVFVYNGTYYENVIVNKKIDLIGEDRNNTIIDGSGTGDVIYISANQVTISNFTIKNSGSTGDDAGIDIRSDDNTLQDNILLDTHYAFNIGSSSDYNSIKNNKISDSVNAIRLQVAITESITWNNVSCNLINNCSSYGIAFGSDWWYNYNIQNNLFSYNIIKNCSSSVYFSSNGGGGNMNYNTFDHNELRDGQYGVYLTGANGPIISYNTFTNNVFTNFSNYAVYFASSEMYGNYIDHTNTYNGERFYHAGLVNDKYISDFYFNASNPTNLGLMTFYSSTNITLYNCTIKGGSISSWIYHSSDIILTNCSISDSTNIGIYILGSSSNDIKNCTITGAANYAIRLETDSNSNNNNITNNSIFSGSTGIYLYVKPEGSITANNILNNKIENCSSYGVLIGSDWWYNYNIQNNLFSYNIIKNCPSAVYFSSNGGGGHMNYNTFDYNDFINGQYGLYLTGANGPDISQNTFSNNTFKNQSLYAAYIAQSTLNNNLFYNNFFNSTNNAFDAGLNKWNITKTSGTNIIGGPYLGGNYWTDYTGADSNGDGLGDTNLPYNNGIATGGDWLPLTEIGFDTIPPEITNVYASPDPQFVGGFVNITCDVIDNVDVDEVRVNVTGPAGFIPVNVSMNTGSYFFNTSYSVPGMYMFFIWANDTSGNSNVSTGHSFDIQDTTSPEITNVSANPDPQQTGGYVNITCDVDDNVDVDEVRVNITYPDSSYHNETMLEGSYYWNASYTLLGTYYFFIWANDTSGNSNMSSFSSFVIQDSTFPVISNVDAQPDPQEVGGFVNITCEVYDNVAVDEVCVNITNPDSSYHNVTMLEGSYYYNTTYNQVGIYDYFIWANDTSGNANISTLYSFSIVDLSAYTAVSLKEQWNLISLPFNQSINKTDIYVSCNGHNYTWNDALIQGVILGFIYNWSSSSQSYITAEVLDPGYGYWIWAYYDCTLLIDENANDDEYITTLENQWNIVGIPSDELLWKNNLIIHYNNTDYSWYEATTNNNEEGEPLILGFIYGWNSIIQNYELSDELIPGYGYWMYAYYDCVLKREVS